LNAEYRRLKARLDRIATVKVPYWLHDAEPEDIAEYKAKLRAHRRSGHLRDWLMGFIRRMRLKYPDMPLSFEEQMEAGVEKLRKDIECQKREGLIRESPTTRT